MAIPALSLLFFALASPLPFEVPGSHVEAYLHPAASQAAVEQKDAAVDPLALSFDVVSRMPARPHLKTRSRLQADLVQAALDVGRLDDALAWAGKIENWRRGLALAHVAVFHANSGDEEGTRAALKVAEAAEAKILDEMDQGWRRDRVRVRIAEAYALIGDRVKAAQIQAITTPTESGRLASMAVRTVAASDQEKQLATLEQIAKTGDLEQIRFAVLAMAEFYGQALRSPEGDEEGLSPKAVEDRIRAAWDKLPIEPRLDILEKLANLEIESGTKARAAQIAGEISAMVTENRWNAEQGIGLRGRAASLLHRAGETKAARDLANEALALYESSREGIYDIFRGEALRPLARSFVTLGDHATAAVIYERALEEAVHNPNSKPRATDIAMTAISAATAPGFEMPKSLLRAFAAAETKIGTPW
ncbi:MAG: tetratricopeptide repeat protein [Planctomycetota bacterium]